MQVIKEDIKNNKYRPVYLLWGTEEYLKKLYQDKLKEAILQGSDDMNYSYFEGKGIDEASVVEIAQTLPFFNDKRLVVLKNTGLFKTAGQLADSIRTLPETTILVFVESEVDKRNRLFKAVKEIGYISEMNGMKEEHLKLWVASLLKKEDKKITEQNISYLLAKSGTDMKNLENEIEKLVSYAYEREVITKEDIDAVCTTQITGKIFQMIDAIGSHRQNDALKLYYDLLALREKPLSILFLLTRHFNILLQVKDLQQQGIRGQQMAAKIGIPPFTVSKYMTQAGNFKKEQLVEILTDCLDTEESIKTGRILETIGVELLLVMYSRAS